MEEKKEAKHGEIEFHNYSIQVFTTVYRLYKSAWKNTCLPNLVYNLEIEKK